MGGRVFCRLHTHAQAVKLFEKMYILYKHLFLRSETWRCNINEVQTRCNITDQPDSARLLADAFRWFRRVGPSNIFLFRLSTHDRALTNGQHAFFGTPQERSNNGSWPLGLQESINEKKQMGVVSGRSPTQGKCLKNEGLMLGCPSLQIVYTRNNYHSVEEHLKALCVHWIFRNLLVPAMDIQARNVWRSCKGHRVAWTWSFSPSPSTNLRYQISKID